MKGKLNRDLPSKKEHPSLALFLNCFSDVVVFSRGMFFNLSWKCSGYAGTCRNHAGINLENLPFFLKIPLFMAKNLNMTIPAMPVRAGTVPECLGRTPFYVRILLI